MRRIPIRVKLAAALAVPLIAVGLVTLVEVMSVAAEVRDVRDQTELATATIGPKGLLTATTRAIGSPGVPGSLRTADHAV